MTDSNPYFIIAIDDRVDICSEVLNTTGQPTAADREKAANLKRIVFEGITSAVEHGLPKSSVAVWADNDLGESAILRAKAMAMATVCSPGGGPHSLGRLDVDFTGVHLTFDPEGQEAARSELLERLKAVSDTARAESMPLLIELDTVPTQAQIETYNGLPQARSMLLLKSVKHLQDKGVEPAIWVFDPVADETLLAALSAQAHVDDRIVKVLVVSSGDLVDSKSEPGLSQYEKRITHLAARTPGIDGMLVGPGAYFQHLVRFNNDSITRAEIIDAIALHLRHLHEIFENSRSESTVV